MSGQTLIFSVGAAKSGTSWLQSFLRAHDDCYFRHQKELHYFSVLDKGGNPWHINRLAGILKDKRAQMAATPEAAQSPWLQGLTSDIEEWLGIFDGKTPVDSAYLDYIGYGRVDAKVVGDITPDYGHVSRKMLRHMASLGDDVKFIYIMRDPVERMWSGLRMVLDRHGEAEMESRMMRFLSGEDEGAAISQTYDYQGTLQKLLEVIPRENLYIEFYETMFTQGAMDRLCDFLGVSHAPAPVDKVVHRGKRLTLPSVLKVEFLKKLEPQYSFVDKTLGGVPLEWTENMVSA